MHGNTKLKLSGEYYSDYQIKKNEINGERGEEGCVWSFGGEIEGMEIIWETQAKMGG